MSLFKEKWCMQVNRSYSDAPQYIIGSKKKISQLFDDMERTPGFFKETIKMEDGLPALPEMKVTGGHFGYVPNKNVPITAVASYYIDRPEPKKKSSGGFRFIKGMFITGMVLFGLFVAASGLFAFHMEKQTALLDDLTNECYVTVKNGEAQSISVFGEVLYFDRDGSVVIPDQREITHQDARRFERPYEYCSIVSVDGTEPIRRR